MHCFWTPPWLFLSFVPEVQMRSFDGRAKNVLAWYLTLPSPPGSWKRTSSCWGWVIYWNEKPLRNITATRASLLLFDSRIWRRSYWIFMRFRSFVHFLFCKFFSMLVHGNEACGLLNGAENTERLPREPNWHSIRLDCLSKCTSSWNRFDAEEGRLDARSDSDVILGFVVFSPPSSGFLTSSVCMRIPTKRM